uniref:RNase H type-1 domain-containing protein n=1 Tax=Timema monikensis TaxID=170555 RepID=A0A7R9EI58_9NEOP|nr:unnamed protein product [Timema monikensis]
MQLSSERQGSTACEVDYSDTAKGAFLSLHGSKSCPGLGLAARPDGGGWSTVLPSMSIGIMTPSHAPVASLPGDNTVKDIFSLEQKALTLETLFKDTARKLALEIKSVKKSCKEFRKGGNGAGTDSGKLLENLSQKLATFETDYKVFESTLWRDLVEVKQMMAQLNGTVGKVERLSARDKIASMVKPMTPGAVLMANKRSLSTSTATSSKGSDTLCDNESYKRLLSEDDDVICLAESAHKLVKTEPANTSVTDSSVPLQFQLDQQGFVQVYTDGACEKNGFAGAKAGIGVWFGMNHPLNTSEPVRGRATNNTAEIQAAVLAIELAKSAGVKKLCINTDSQFLINSITKWIRKWRRNNWKLTDGGPVKNKEDFVMLDAALKSVVVKWNHVRGHQGILGNEMADQLAKAGAERFGQSQLPKLDSGQVVRTAVKTALLLSVQCHTSEDCKCDKTLKPVQIPGLDKVSHEALIRQACAGSLETSSQLITFTTTAILDTAHKYRDSMNRLMNLLEESMDPNVSEHYKSSLNDRIVAVRVESADLRNCLLVSSISRYQLQCLLNVTAILF